MLFEKGFSGHHGRAIIFGRRRRTEGGLLRPDAQGVRPDCDDVQSSFRQAVAGGKGRGNQILTARQKRIDVRGRRLSRGLLQIESGLEVSNYCIVYRKESARAGPVPGLDLS